MANFTCTCGMTLSVSNIKVKIDGKQFKPTVPVICTICKSEMDLQLEEVTVGDVEFNPLRFNSLSPEDKKAVIHKRAKWHHDKFCKSDVEQKRADIINSVKQKFEEGINYDPKP